MNKCQSPMSGKAKSIPTLALLILPFALLASCSLLPVEEEAPNPPVIRSYDKTEYELADVVKGDIIKSVRISCQYSPARKESLAFTVKDIRIENVYVELGDNVKKGDVLAELEHGTLVSQIDAQTLAIEQLKLSTTQLKDSFRLNLESANVKLDSLEEDYKNAESSMRAYCASLVSAQKKVIDSLTDNYELQLDINNTSLKSAQIKLDDLKKQNNARILTAAIDGTVTYVKKTDPYSKSVENENFITVTDKTSSVFIVSGDDAARLKPGDDVSVQLNNEYHDATVIPASDLGVKPTDRLTYVCLNEAAFDIQDNATGSITLVLESHKDVVYIPALAVKTANGKSVTYILNENGIKTMCEIKTGFSADGKVEILSGLEPGQQVILE